MTIHRAFFTDNGHASDGQPRLLDLFCCAGGAAKGYQRAGFHVTGVDIQPQAKYCGDRFHQGDALEFLAEHWQEFDVIHASPCCQSKTRVTDWRGSRANHPDLLLPTLRMLRGLSVPWVVENVMEAVWDGTLRPDLILCGSMFGLPLRRHRAFETSWHAYQVTPRCSHRRGDLSFGHRDERIYADAMGCTWMTAREGRQAIPPAYTEYLGGLLRDQVSTAVAAQPTERH